MSLISKELGGGMTAISATRKRRLEIQSFVGLDGQTVFETALWIRFAFSLCTILAATGTVLASPAILWSLTPIAALGAIFPVHPFDFIYNNIIRGLTKTRVLPKRGAPSRFACGLGAVWLLAAGYAFYSGAQTLGYVLGGALTLVGALVSTMDFCIPSLIYRTVFGFPSKSESKKPGLSPNPKMEGKHIQTN